ncbi:MAG: ABC transporter permease [Clostridia bacterium]|nr:ABC transporter permease [Clostridia bacterium]MBQ2730427.1 ABC transporter permease [Clostridia bacterium]
MSNANTKQHREPLFHVVKRTELSTGKAWLVRGAAILLGFLISGILSVLLTGKGFFEIYEIMFKGVFGMLFAGRLSQFWVFLQKTAILLCLSLAVTPAFKMKFWNCGAEGQALISGLVSMFLMISLGGKVADWFLVILVVVCGILAGALWGIIPALFKAHFNTNETLFTLMMNYVATQIVAYYVYLVGQGSGIIQPVSYGNLPKIPPSDYFLNILVVVAVMIVMSIYLRHSKQGYEIAVVGESQNTARYIGINVKKVILRTMAISGAVCGLAGVLMVAGTDHSVNTNSMGGQGFTAIMISWLGQFNPYIMAGMSALVIFLQVGAAKVADSCFMNSSFADIVAGIVILLLVGSEFFIRYSVKFRTSKKEEKQ